MPQTRRYDLTHVRMDAAGSGPVTIAGTAVPYGHDITYHGQVERFAPGAIDPAAVVGAPLMWGHNYHDPSAWLGSVTAADNTDTGLIVQAEVIDLSVAGKLRAAATPPGLSVGVQIDHATHEDDQSVTYNAATLRELSVTTIPAYGDQSMIAAVRHDMEQETPAVTEPTPPDVPPVDLTPLSDRLDQLEARMHTPAEPPARTLSVRDAFAAGLAEAARTRQTRALADVLSSGNAGVLPPQWSSEVRDYVDAERYVMAAAGSLAFPSTGYTLTVPKVTQHTLVGPRGTEKTEVPSRALTTDSDTYTAQWFAGAVDVALELIEQSDPSILSLLVSSMLRQYAIATETAVVTAVNGAATAAGRAIDTTDYAAFVDDVWVEADKIRQLTGTPGNLLALTAATWRKLVGFVDTNGRRMLAPIGPGDADGTASLLARSVDLGGVRAFYAPSATVDLQFNTVALRVAEKPPMQLTVDNPALMGRDIGILGAVLVAPFYPAGIIAWTA